MLLLVFIMGRKPPGVPLSSEVVIWCYTKVAVTIYIYKFRKMQEALKPVTW